MTNNTCTAIYACLLLLAITVGACVKDSTVPESIHKQPQDFRLTDAILNHSSKQKGAVISTIWNKLRFGTDSTFRKTDGHIFMKSPFFITLPLRPQWDI